MEFEEFEDLLNDFIHENVKVVRHGFFPIGADIEDGIDFDKNWRQNAKKLWDRIREE